MATFTSNISDILQRHHVFWFSLMKEKFDELYEKDGWLFFERDEKTGTLSYQEEIYLVESIHINPTEQRKVIGRRFGQGRTKPTDNMRYGLKTDYVNTETANRTISLSDFCWSPIIRGKRFTNYYSLEDSLDEILVLVASEVQPFNFSKDRARVVNTVTALLEQIVTSLQLKSPKDYQQLLQEFRTRMNQKLTDAYETTFILAGDPLSNPKRSQLTRDWFEKISIVRDEKGNALFPDTENPRQTAKILYDLYIGNDIVVNEIRFSWGVGAICYLITKMSETKSEFKATAAIKKVAFIANGHLIKPTVNISSNVKKFKEKKSPIKSGIDSLLEPFLPKI